MSKILNFRNSLLKTCSVSINKLIISSLKDKFSSHISEKLIIIICLIQHFEADFPQKVSLKILNSGIILKTFTHAIIFSTISYILEIQHFLKFEAVTSFEVSNNMWDKA